MKSKKMGFTLIELVVVIAIMGTIITTVFSVLDSGNALYKNGMKIENLETNGRMCIDVLSQKIKTSKVYYDTLEMDDPIFDTAIYNGNYIQVEDRIAYIEDYNNNRYMYILVENQTNKRKQLHQLKLAPQGRYKYRFEETIISQPISSLDISTYNDSAQDEVEYATGDIDSAELSRIPSGYSPKYFLYENYGEQCYLWAVKGTDNVKFKLIKNPNVQLIIDSTPTTGNDSIIGDYIDQVCIKGVSGSSGVKVTKDEVGGTSEIYVNIYDNPKRKIITTNVFLLNSNNSVQ